MKVKESEVVQSCPTLCHPTDCSLPGSSVYGIFQARILKWVAISFSRRSSWSRACTWVSRIVGRCFTIWATWEAQVGISRHHTSFLQVYSLILGMVNLGQGGMAQGMACENLVPWQGIKSTPPALEAWSLNHWTAKKIPLWWVNFMYQLD